MGEIGWATNVDGQELDAEQLSRVGEQLRSRRRAGCIAEDGEARARGCDLLQELKPLRVELASEDTNPGGVAAGLGQAVDQPGGDDVVNYRDDRDRVRRLLGRAHRRIAGGDDNARLLADQRLREFRESLGMSLGELELDADVAVIDLPERRQGAPKDSRERLDVIRCVNAQDADEREVFGILRKYWNRVAKPNK